MPKEKILKNTPVKAETPDASLTEYAAILADLKHQIKEAQLKASMSVNKELLRLYWNIGSSILEKQAKYGWGTKVVRRLVNDLRSAFPTMKGFSLTNVKYMVQFAREYPDFLIGQQVVGQIPWGHNMLLMDKLKTIDERLWYAKKTIENGRLLKKENDNPSIGLILCKSKSKIQVEIALQDINKPIGVSDYIVSISDSIPKELKSSLPTIAEIEAELAKNE